MGVVHGGVQGHLPAVAWRTHVVVASVGGYSKEPAFQAATPELANVVVGRNKGFLGDVFCRGRVTQQPSSHVKDQLLIAPDQFVEGFKVAFLSKPYKLGRLDI